MMVAVVVVVLLLLGVQVQRVVPTTATPAANATTAACARI